MSEDNALLRTVYIDPETDRKLKQLSVETDQPISTLIREAIEEDPRIQLHRTDMGIGKTLSRRAPLALRT